MQPVFCLIICLIPIPIINFIVWVESVRPRNAVEEAEKL